jgi:universal stress protein E
MEKPRHILVIIDPTATRHPALARAEALARAFGARVELFICHTAHTEALRVDEIKLEELAQGLREKGIDVTTDEASDAAVYTGILRKVLHAKPSLVVKDTHPHSLLRRSLIVNTDWQLIRLCPAPVLFVRPGEWRHPPRIAAAVDIALPGEKPARLDRQLLSAAETFSLAMNGELHAVHAFAPVSALAATVTPLGVPMAAGVDPARIVADGETLARDQFEELLATHPMPPEHRHLRAGHAGDVLVEFAREWHIDLLVLGAFARGWMYNVLVGSTTERVLDLLPCDVLVMKPASFRCPVIREFPSTSPEPRSYSD